MSKLVAITGGTGFIGSEIIRVLKGSGFKVRALVREQSREKLIAQQVDEVVYGDLFNDKALRQFVKDADTIVNCAGKVRGISISSFFDSNVYGLSNLLNHVEKFNIGTRFLHISSVAAKDPRVSPYAFSKWRSEAVLKERCQSVQWTILRPPVVYGWGDKEVTALLNMMQSGFFPIVGKGYNRFSILHVADLAQAVLSCIQSQHCENKIYELDDGKANGYSWKEIVDYVSRVYGKKIRVLRIPSSVLYVCSYLNIALHGVLRKPPMFSPGKVREMLHTDWTCDNSNFINDTDWQPRMDLNTGLLNQ